jgi:hypothetical protein
VVSIANQLRVEHFFVSAGGAQVNADEPISRGFVIAVTDGRITEEFACFPSQQA